MARHPTHSILCPQCETIFHPRPSDILMGKGTYCSRSCADIGRRETLEQRFWRNVQKTNHCWLWTGLIGTDGYGKTWTSGKGARTLRAPRVSWELHYGTIPKGMFVCHHCDTRPCVRPDHLFLGDHAHNMADKVAKGRQAKGLKLVGTRCHARGVVNGNAKLTDEIVQDIRNQYAQGIIFQDKLARIYNVDQTTISSIVLRKIWKHI